jgi:zinc D-Ala-D-Ala dipeptidase
MLTATPTINDPAVLAVSARDCGEPLVPLTNIPRLYLPAEVEGLPPREGPRVLKPRLVRSGVRDRLIALVEALPADLGLMVSTGYRSEGVQRRILSRHPTAAGTFVSDPDLFSPHLTGGAVDLALVDGDRRVLDFGAPIGVFSPAAYWRHEPLTAEQRRNRLLLAEALQAQGFVNYPYEWWHWSYGDRYWGYVTKQDAIYDRTAPAKQPKGWRQRIGGLLRRFRFS